MKTILTFLALNLAPAAFGDFDKGPVVRSMRTSLENEGLGAAADQAFDRMFRMAGALLVEHGHKLQGEQLINEWTNLYQGQLRGFSPKDTGDHAPLYVWIDIWYSVLQATLGDEILEATHLSDIYLLNHEIPVVFNPFASEDWCKYQLMVHPQDTCAKEYERHFAGTKWVRGEDPYATSRPHDGFAGIVTYWACFISCEAALWGGDATLLCSPVSSLAEIAMERYFAPGISAKIWARKNPSSSSSLEQ